MGKLLFELLTSPLGLPINPIWEYIILFITGGIAYRLAYHFVGRFIDDDIVPNKKVASIVHWTLRLVIYAFTWVLIRNGIALYMWLFR